MIATIVTSTTVTTVAVITLGGSLALIGIIALMTLLISKDVTTVITSERAQRVDKTLNIALIPLAVVFVLVIVAKVAELLK